MKFEWYNIRGYEDLFECARSWRMWFKGPRMTEKLVDKAIDIAYRDGWESREEKDSSGEAG